MHDYSYLTNCISSDANSINDMRDNARPITYRTFTRNTNWKEIALSLGYNTDSRLGLTLKNDWHVAYYKSTYQGQPCYYMVWSYIEHIFVKES